MVDVKQVDLERLRAAFDSFDVVEKNIVLRKAYDAIEAYEARIAELERERDSWREQFDSAAAAASEYSEFWERHHFDFDSAGNYIPHSQIDGDLRAAESRLASYDALVEALRRWNDWHRKATADDDCEYLNGDGWADASETWHFADAALKKVGR